MVRLSDIAQKTGYTISTISKALNHSSEISQETSKIIWNAAREMGYVSRKSMKRAKIDTAKISNSNISSAPTPNYPQEDDINNIVDN